MWNNFRDLRLVPLMTLAEAEEMFADCEPLLTANLLVERQGTLLAPRCTSWEANCFPYSFNRTPRALLVIFALPNRRVAVRKRRRFCSRTIDSDHGRYSSRQARTNHVR